MRLKSNSTERVKFNSELLVNEKESEIVMSNIVKSEVSTVVSQKQVMSFVERYRLSVKKTAESILELANVVYSAKSELSKDEFKQFRVEIGADASKDSYLKKLTSIAEKSQRFDCIKDKLPASYTTLYALAKLKPDEFDVISKSEIISPRMTASDLSTCLGKTKNASQPSSSKSVSAECVTFTIDIKDVDQTTVTRVVKELSEVCKSYGLHYELQHDAKETSRSEVVQDVEFEELLAA